MENQDQENKIKLEGLQLRIGDTIFNTIEAEIDNEATNLTKRAINEAQSKLNARSEALRYSTDQAIKTKELEIEQLKAKYANVIPALTVKDALALRKRDITASARNDRLALMRPYTYYPLYITDGNNSNTYRLPQEIRNTLKANVEIVLLLRSDYSTYTIMLFPDSTDRLFHAHYVSSNDCIGDMALPNYEAFFNDNNEIRDIEAIVSTFNRLAVLWQTINIDSLGISEIDGVDFRHTYIDLEEGDAPAVQTAQWTT